MENFSPDHSNQDTSSSSIEILDVPKVCPPLLDIASSDSDPSYGKEDICGSTVSESYSEPVQNSRLQIPTNLTESSDSESIASSEKITNEKAPNVKASEREIAKKKKPTNKSDVELQKTKSTISEVAGRVKTGSTLQLIDIASSDTCGSTGDDESSESVQDSRLQNSSNSTESSDSESITSSEKITNEKEPNVEAGERDIIKKKNPRNKYLKELPKTKSTVSEVIDIVSSDTDPSNEREEACGSTESEYSSEAEQDSRLQNPSNLTESSDSESISSSEKVTNVKKSNVTTSEIDIIRKKKPTNKSTKQLQKTKSNISGVAHTVEKRTLKSISRSKRRKIERKSKMSDSKTNFRKKKKYVGEKINENPSSRRSDLPKVYHCTSNEMSFPERANDTSDVSDKRSRATKIHKVGFSKHPIPENPSKSKSSLNKTSSNNALLEKASKRKKHSIRTDSTKLQKKMAKSTENFSGIPKHISEKTKTSKIKNYCKNKLVLQNSDKNLEMSEPGDMSNTLCRKKMIENRILQKSKMPKVYQCTSNKMSFPEEEIQRNSAKVQKKKAKSPENFYGKAKVISKKPKMSKNKFCKNQLVVQNYHKNLDTPEDENMSNIVCEKNEEENRISSKSSVPKIYQRTSTEMPFPEAAKDKSDASDKQSRAKKIHKIENSKYSVSENPSKPKFSLNKNSTNNVLLGMTNRKQNHSIQRNRTKKKKKIVESSENVSGKEKNISKKPKMSETKKYCKNMLVLQNRDNNSETPVACEKMMNENQISGKSKVLKIYQRTSTEMPLPVDESNKSGASDNNSRVSEIHKTEPPKHRVSAKVSRSKSSLNKNSSNNVLLGMGNRRKNQSIRRNSTKSQKKMANSTENISGKINISNKTNSSKNKKYRKDKLVLESCDNIFDIPETRHKSNNESDFHKTLDRKFPSYRETDFDSNYSRNNKVFSNIKNKNKYKTCPEVRKIISDVLELPSSENSNVCTEIQYPSHSKRNSSGHLKRLRSKFKAKEYKRRMRQFQEKVRKKKQAQG